MRVRIRIHQNLLQFWEPKSDSLWTDRLNNIEREYM